MSEANARKMSVKRNGLRKRAMTQLSKMVSFSVCAAVLFLVQRAAAQNYVTPMVQPTPPGQLIVVNNSPARTTMTRMSAAIL